VHRWVTSPFATFSAAYRSTDAVTLVVVRVASGASFAKRQRKLRTLERLNLRLLVDASTIAFYGGLTPKRGGDVFKVACALTFEFSRNTCQLLRRVPKWLYSFGPWAKGRISQRGSVASVLFPHTVLSYQHAAGGPYTPPRSGALRDSNGVRDAHAACSATTPW